MQQSGPVYKEVEPLLAEYDKANQPMGAPSREVEPLLAQYGNANKPGGTSGNSGSPGNRGGSGGSGGSGSCQGGGGSDGGGGSSGGSGGSGTGGAGGSDSANRLAPGAGGKGTTGSTSSDGTGGTTVDVNADGKPDVRVTGPDAAKYADQVKKFADENSKFKDLVMQAAKANPNGVFEIDRKQLGAGPGGEIAGQAPLGQAGEGVMQFGQADIDIDDQGQLDKSVLVHEMLHNMGYNHTPSHYAAIDDVLAAGPA